MHLSFRIFLESQSSLVRCSPKHCLLTPARRIPDAEASYCYIEARLRLIEACFLTVKQSNRNRDEFQVGFGCCN